MNNEREELARDVFLADNANARPGLMEKEWDDDKNHYPYAYNIADGLLAKGYRKPQQATTVEELNALPTESVVRSRGEIVWEKFSDEDGIVCWRTPGSKAPAAGLNISLPATVLHTGSQP